MDLHQSDIQNPPLLTDLDAVQPTFFDPSTNAHALIDGTTSGQIAASSRKVHQWYMQHQFQQDSGIQSMENSKVGF
jgi:hypothetical protein